MLSPNKSLQQVHVKYKGESKVGNWWFEKELEKTYEKVRFNNVFKIAMTSR
jgi:hypothetical protein